MAAQDGSFYFARVHQRLSSRPHASHRHFWCSLLYYLFLSIYYILHYDRYCKMRRYARPALLDDTVIISGARHFLLFLDKYISLKQRSICRWVFHAWHGRHIYYGQWLFIRCACASLVDCSRALLYYRQALYVGHTRAREMRGYSSAFRFSAISYSSRLLLIYH